MQSFSTSVPVALARPGVQLDQESLSNRALPSAQAKIKDFRPDLGRLGGAVEHNRADGGSPGGGARRSGQAEGQSGRAEQREHRDDRSAQARTFHDASREVDL